MSTPLHLQPLAPYEDRLLSALAFFRFKRDRAVQARHCLSMYLRQGEGRITREVSFYARHLGMTPEELLELIYTDGEVARSRFAAVFGPGDAPILMDADESADSA
ncbi:MAG: hypothetical protein F6J87_02560 [Spirulina sp. SIO3F2]|nr:hypothetical protein [Spirulina sp. SIO3F2]